MQKLGLEYWQTLTLINSVMHTFKCNPYDGKNWDFVGQNNLAQLPNTVFISALLPAPSILVSKQELGTS